MVVIRYPNEMLQRLKIECTNKQVLREKKDSQYYKKIFDEIDEKYISEMT